MNVTIMRKLFVTLPFLFGVSLVANIIVSQPSSALYTEAELKEYLGSKSTPKDVPITPDKQSKMSAQSAGLTGRTSFNSQTTQTKAPVLSGTVPSYCNDVGVLLFTDNSNFDTNEGLYAFFSDYGQVSLSSGNWSINLQSAGLNLINGKYNIFVSSKCGYSASYDDPLYSDIYMDGIYVIPAGCDGACLPVHRFYNTQNGAHFYTSNEEEKRSVLNTIPAYRYEGIVSFGKQNMQSGTVAVHRFYHKLNGTHFYTSNQAEASNINNTQYGTYRYEGVAYYAYEQPVAESVSMHRFYKFRQGVHFYTANQSEASSINANQYNTYRYEGVPFYNVINQ